MGTDVKSLRVSVSVLAEMLQCSYLSETRALLLVLLVPKIAFSPGTLVLDAPEHPRKRVPM